MIFQNGRLFVASYQGRILAIDLNAGRPLWSEDVSTTVGLGAGFGNVYLASVSDQLTAYDMDNGRIQWSTDALSNRDVTTPVTTGSFIAVADFEGYVHLIAQSDGRFVGRRRVDSKGIYTPVLAADNRLFVMGNSGRLSVFELQ
jgi:outer membrane protein assembly factor BamB